MITDVAGVRVGHWSDAEARTGCTVIRFPEGTLASGEVRGGAPATREFELLHPSRLVERLDALVLAGGSAFGLATADGVMMALEAEGVGFPTTVGVVPIVVGLCLYDLGVGDATVRPGPVEGQVAFRTASPGPYANGQVGAGTGATVGKWRGPDGAEPGGLGSATVRDEEVVVSALMAVNATGDVGDEAASADQPDLSSLRRPAGEAYRGENTTIGVVVTNARLTKTQCLLVAQGGHDGMARALFPPHTGADGDAIVAAATGQVDAGGDLVRALAVVAVERAIRDAVHAGGRSVSR